MIPIRPVFSLMAVACTAGALVGCRDLHLVDPAENTSAGGNSDSGSPGGAGVPAVRTNTGSLPSNTGGKPGNGGMSNARGGAFNANGGAFNANGGAFNANGGALNANGGAHSSVAPSFGSSANGGVGAGLGGVPAPSGGSSLGGSMPGGSTRGGGAPSIGGATAQGGSPGGNHQSGGTGGTLVGAGGTSQLVGAGTSPCMESLGCGGIPQSEHLGVGGSTGPNPTLCPKPITKPKALTDAEPKPNDPCARVTTVVSMGPMSSAFGFTNGEIWFCSWSVSFSCSRADAGGMPGNVQSGLPKAIVSALKSIRHNNEGTLSVGYVDASAELTPWHTGQLGRGWYSTPVSNPGTVMSLFSCPFHGNRPTHNGIVTAPAYISESVSSMPEYKDENGRTIAEHLGLFDGFDDVTTVDTHSDSERWLVLAGSYDGALVKSGWIHEDAVTWNEESHSLSFPVAWISLRTPELPVAPVVRVAVDPKDSNRILVVFNRRKIPNESETADALWLTEDGGATWSNRSKGLPTTTSHRYPPPLLGATFHPTLRDVAYVVTPDTSYYTTNSGQTWLEW